MGTALNWQMREVIGLESEDIVTDDILGPMRSDRYRGVVDLWR